MVYISGFLPENKLLGVLSYKYPNDPWMNRQN